MKAVIALTSVLFLGGCGFTSTGDALRDAIATKGAQAYDEGLVNAEWYMCKAASVGSVLRRYGASPEKAEAWRAMCAEPDGTGIVTP